MPRRSHPKFDAQAIELALDAMPVGVSWATLADQKILFMNRKFTEIFGYSVADFRDIGDWIGQYPFEEDRALAGRRWGPYFQAPTGKEHVVEAMELRIRCKEGTIKTVLHHGVILPEAGWALATFVDISDRKRDEIFLRAASRKARESEAIYRTLLDHAPEMSILSPFGNAPRYVSPAVLKVTGFTAEEYVGRETVDLVHPEDYELGQIAIEALRAGSPSQVVRYRTLQKNGTYRWVEGTFVGYIDPETKQTAGYVATVRDISGLVSQERSAASEHLRLLKAAAIDELTGVANRRTFNQSLLREARRQTRSTGELSVLMLDVDSFKCYNDRFGHLAGDVCLRAVAQAIEAIVGRNADLVARFGGEEFVVLAPMTTSAGAEILAQRIIEAVMNLALPHPDSAHGVVTISIGVTTWAAGQAIDQPLLLNLADRALYEAKDGGRNTYRVINPEPRT